MLPPRHTNNKCFSTLPTSVCVFAFHLFLQRGGFFTEKVSLSPALSWSARQAALQRSGDEECDNKEVEDREVLVCTHTHTHTQQLCAVVIVSTALAPLHCKQEGGDRLPELVNIISVIQQMRRCHHHAGPRHNQH